MKFYCMQWTQRSNVGHARVDQLKPAARRFTAQNLKENAHNKQLLSRKIGERESKRP